jgi:hypothetical protein
MTAPVPTTVTRGRILRRRVVTPPTFASTTQRLKAADQRSQPSKLMRSPCASRRPYCLIKNIPHTSRTEAHRPKAYRHTINHTIA